MSAKKAAATKTLRVRQIRSGNLEWSKARAGPPWPGILVGSPIPAAYEEIVRGLRRRREVMRSQNPALLRISKGDPFHLDKAFTVLIRQIGPLHAFKKLLPLLLGSPPALAGFLLLPDRSLAAAPDRG